MPEPKKGQGDYGYKKSKDKDVIMRTTLGKLLEEYSRKNYTTYPIGFYKNVILDKGKDEKIGEIIEEIGGVPAKHIQLLFFLKYLFYGYG